MARTSHARRRSPNFFGLGILPSLTISSNMVGDTERYAAAASRPISRGGSVGGKAVCRATKMMGLNDYFFSVSDFDALDQAAI